MRLPDSLKGPAASQGIPKERVSRIRHLLAGIAPGFFGEPDFMESGPINGTDKLMSKTREKVGLGTKVEGRKEVGGSSGLEWFTEILERVFRK